MPEQSIYLSLTSTSNSSWYVPASQRGFYKPDLMEFVQRPWEVGTIMIPILQREN